MFFASDNSSGAAPEIMAALAEATRGYVKSYGADALTERVTTRVVTRGARPLEGDRRGRSAPKCRWTRPDTTSCSRRPAAETTTFAGWQSWMAWAMNSLASSFCNAVSFAKLASSMFDLSISTV